MAGLNVRALRAPRLRNGTLRQYKVGELYTVLLLTMDSIHILKDMLCTQRPPTVMRCLISSQSGIEIKRKKYLKESVFIHFFELGRLLQKFDARVTEF